MSIKVGLSIVCERHQVGGGNRHFEVAEKVPFCGRIDLSKEGNGQRPLEANAVRYRGVRHSDVLAEKSGAGAADKKGDPFEGALPKRWIDGGIV